MNQKLKRASFAPSIVCLGISIAIFLVSQYLVNPKGVRWQPFKTPLSYEVGIEQHFSFEVDFQETYLVDLLLPPKVRNQEELGSYMIPLLGETQQFFPIECTVSLNGQAISEARKGLSSSGPYGIAFGCAKFSGQPGKNYQLQAVVTAEHEILSRYPVEILAEVHPSVYKDDIVSASLFSLLAYPLLLIALISGIRPLYHRLYPPKADQQTC